MFQRFVRTSLAPLFVLALLAAAPAFAQVDTGDADFSHYVAIGDSLTAGFSSNGLSREFQANSYPALIYRQATGRTTGFEQPLVTEPGIPPVLQLVSLSPLVIAPRAGQGQPANLTLQRPYDNLAVPGADARDVRFTVTDNGGLHDLILRGLGTQLQQALALRPSFVTVWIGNNDALAAATSGVVIEDVTLTSVESFQTDYRAIVQAIAATGAEMAIANIPDVSVIPFVTTLPPVVVNPATNQPVLVNGAPVPLIGPDGPLGPADRVLLSASTELRAGRGIPAALGGSGQPLSNNAVLSAGEVAIIRDRIAAYNGIIRTVANEVGAAFVDINALLQRLATTGIPVGGVTLTENFLTGGVFSYDGVHPNAFGYAFVANQFIAAINEEFDAEIPPVALYPFLFGPEVVAVPGTGNLGAPLLTEAAQRYLRWVIGTADASGGEPPKPARRKPGAPGRRGRGKGH